MFKSIILSVALFLCSVVMASAAPLMTVTKNSGFVLPRFAYHIECSVGALVTTRRIRLGESSRTIIRNVPTRYTQTIPNSRSALNFIILAARGRIDITRGPTDGPTSSYHGFYSGRRVMLLVDQSIRKYRNTAPTVSALLELGNRNCPTP